MGIARQSIEDLKRRSKISDFILATTSGKLRGTKGMALCPFHGEKTASMSFTDVENLFHCFGCKEGGDIFKYVQEINNLEFQDAIEFVAEKYGFELTYTQTSDNNDFKVYHFASTVIKRIDFSTKDKMNLKSKGNKTFLLKWGMSTKFFRKFYLKTNSKYTGPLIRPKKVWKLSVVEPTISPFL